MAADITPGGVGSVRCPHCSASVFFTMTGGPHELPCPGCRSSFKLDVVHDGRRWAVRRVRPGQARGKPPKV